VPALSAHATPSGVVTEETFSYLRDRLLEGARQAGPCDGVLLSLHGALVAEGCDDGEGEILASLRQVFGSAVPIVSTLDMHANLTARMVSAADALIGYDQLPHVDAGEKGEKAARLLFATVRGERHPAMGWQKLHMLITPENGHTLFGPMAELVARAKEMEREAGVLSFRCSPCSPGWTSQRWDLPLWW